MRVAYVCRALADDRLAGGGAEVYSLACAAARAGHSVHLVCEALPGYRAQPRGPVHVPVAAPRPDHRYPAESLSYADRVYDTLRALHRATPLDVVEFVDTAGEGFTVIRARRLLGEFAGVRLVVAAHPWDRPAAAEPPASLADAIARHLEDYCRRHADEVVTDRPPVTAAGELLPVPPGRSAGPPAGVWFLGDPRPGAGLDTLVAALALPAAPALDLVVRGAPARSGAQSGAVPARVVGHLRAADLAALPPRGTPCVLPAGAGCAPAVARLALALGLGVIAFAGSTCAGVVAEGGGQVVPADDPAALASALRAAAPAPPPRPDPVPAFTAGRPASPVEVTEPELVSVVIPVRDQGRYLPGAVESARHCGYRPVEVVVVDDGSTEPETLAALDALTGVTVLRRPHQGLPSARNAGIATARGPYLVPLDADDLLPAGFVGPAVAALRRDPGIGCVAGTVRNFGLLEHVSVPVGYVPDVSLVVNTFPRATAVFRASAVTAAGGYDPELPAYEDWDLYLRLHKAGYAVECAPLVGQLYRRHADSMTFRQTDRARVALTQHLLRAHADLIRADGALPLLLTLVDLWKSGYEPSASVVWRHQERSLAEVPV